MTGEILQRTTCWNDVHIELAGATLQIADELRRRSAIDWSVLTEPHPMRTTNCDQDHPHVGPCRERIHVAPYKPNPEGRNAR